MGERIMEPYTDSDGPRIERSVLKRMKRLDPHLRVTFCKFAIDPITSIPLPVHPGPEWVDDPEAMKRLCRRGDTHYLLDPGYTLWVQSGDGRFYYVQSYSHEEGFGHREVAKLERDVARFMTPSEIINKRRDAQEARERKQKDEYRQKHADTSKANESRIRDLVFNGNSGYREAKVVSYAGQGNRGTRTQKVLRDAKEDGWELPERE
jgi:hypothetical protein